MIAYSIFQFPLCCRWRRFYSLATGLITLAALLAPASPVFSQEAEEPVSQQVWANYILAFPQNEKLYTEVDFETARQVSGGDPWYYLYGTGMVEYYPAKMVDLTAELVSGYTNQSVEEDSFELTTRWGIRVHFINNLIDYYNKSERFPAKRFSIANLTRVEQRNFWYWSDRPSSHDWRFRNRLEFRVAINKPDFVTDGVWFALADIEWFYPLGAEQAEERFATKQRLRLGAGYRHSFRWRFEALLQRDKARNTLEDDPEVEAHMIDFRVKMSF